MALFLNQNDNRSQLQTKIAAELQERLQESSSQPGKKARPAILDNQQATGKHAWLWIALTCLGIIAVFWVFVS